MLMINLCEEEGTFDKGVVKENIANVKQELAKMDFFLSIQVYKRCVACY